MARHPTSGPRAQGRLLGAGVLVAALLVAMPASGPLATASAARVVIGSNPARGLGPRLGPTAARPLTVDVVLSSSAPSTVRSVLDWLRANGLTAHRSGARLQVLGTSATIGRLLHVRFFDYRRGGTRLYAATPPTVPARLAPDIGALLGLNDVPAAAAQLTVLGPAPGVSGTSNVVAHGTGALPSACPEVAAAATGVVTMTALSARYGISSLLASGETGTGVRVAAIELAASSPSDIASYDGCFGLTPTSVSVVPVDGGGSAGAGTAEADLDIEQIQTQAPGATVISYEAPDTFAGWYDALNAAVQADDASVISISWGMCEALALPPSAGADMLAPIDALLARAASQGQSVVAASGDRGAEDCVNPTAGTGGATLAVDFPASDPNVTAVGGTAVGAQGNDVVWNAATGSGLGGASGGGVSAAFAEPSWQSALAGPLAGSCGTATTCRGTPDVAVGANAIVFYANGSWEQGSGTSFAAPLVAGMVADIAPTCAGPIGNLAPRLYAWATSDSTALSPVTSGENDFTGAFDGTRYTAGGGPYSLAAGLGIPDAAVLSCPVVTAVSSASAPAGATLTLSGHALSSATVRFGTTPATVLAASSRTLRVTVPPGSGQTTITLSDPTGASQPIPFSYGPLSTAAEAASSGPSAPAPEQGAARAPGGRPVLGLSASSGWVLGAMTHALVRCAERCAGTALVRVGAVAAGTARFSLPGGGVRAVAITLSAPALRRLAAAAGHGVSALEVVRFTTGAVISRRVVLHEATVLRSERAPTAHRPVTHGLAAGPH